MAQARSLVPSPSYSGERVRVRGRTSGCAEFRTMQGGRTRPPYMASHTRRRFGSAESSSAHTEEFGGPEPTLTASAMAHLGRGFRGFLRVDLAGCSGLGCGNSLINTGLRC
jgi:hypothetical protein